MHDAWAKLDGEGRALPLTDPAARDLNRLAALAFLHDLGKANTGFWERQFPERQFPGKPWVGHTAEAAPLFYVPAIACEPVPSRLCSLVEAWGAGDLFSATMAHHGRPLEVYAGDEGCPELGRGARCHLRANKRPASYWRPRGGYNPLEQLAQLLSAAEARFPDAFTDGPALPSSASFVSLFCGLLTLADWLGSDTSLFPIDRSDGPERDGARETAAAAAVSGRGFGALNPPVCGFSGAVGQPAPPPARAGQGSRRRGEAEQDGHRAPRYRPAARPLCCRFGAGG